MYVIYCLFIFNTYDNRRYRGLKTALDNKHIIVKYSKNKNMEEFLKLLDDYKVVSGVNIQITLQKSTGETFLHKVKGDKYNTDT